MCLSEYIGLKDTKSERYMDKNDWNDFERTIKKKKKKTNWKPQSKM